MRLLHKFIFIAFAGMLTACSTVKELPSITPPKDAVKALYLQAEGEQIFRCQIDAKGWFWKFEAPNAYLFDPKTNQAVAKYGYGFRFVHNDGSSLDTRILAAHPNVNNNMGNALYQVTRSEYFGQFASIRFVQRTSARGGIPKVKCSQDQRQKILSVPFTADFVFYR